MIKKTTRLTLEILMAITTALLLVVAIFLWRLSQGPMEVPSLNQHIQSSLSDFSDDIDITIERTILEWGGFQKPLAVHVSGVKALNRLGGQIADINEVALNLSIPDLLIGRLLPTHINVMKPSLAITRNQNGRFDINVHRKKSKEKKNLQDLGSDPFKEILEVISNPKRQGIARKLESFTITNSEIFYQDIPNDFVVISPRSDIELIRDDHGIQGVVTLNLDIAGKTEALRGQIDYDFKEQKTNIGLVIDRFNPSIISKLSPNFKNAENFSVPLTGTLNITLNNLFQILSFNLIGTGDEGVITVSQFYQEPLKIDGANIDISYNPNNGSIFMKQLAVDIDGFKADIQGRLTQSVEQGIVTLEAKAGLFNIKADQLPHYWPLGLAPGARNWITKNISDGVVPKAMADLIVSAPITDFSLIDITQLKGDVFVENATVDYLNPMTPVNGVNGIANFTKDKFSIEVTSGKLRDSTIQKGVVDITDLDKKVPNILIDLTIDGKLSDGLFLLASKPLELTKEMGLNHESFTGQATTNLNLAFPLAKGLLKEQVKLKASSKITNIIGTGIITDADVSSDLLNLEANNDQMTIKGKAALAGIPITLDWLEKFGDDVKYVRQMTAKGQVNPDDVKKLTGFDVSDYIVSPFQVVATIQEDQTGAEATVIDLNLKNTAVKLPMISYTKQAGQEARARFDIVEENQGKTSLKNINVSGPDFSLKGRLSVANSVLQSLDFSEFKNNGTDAMITALREKDRYNITFDGASLDAVDIWEKHTKGHSGKDESLEKEDKYPPISIAANVGQLTLNKNQAIRNVKAAIELYPDRVHRMEMDGDAGKGKVYLRYTPFESGTGYQLRFETPDAGAALNAFGLTNKILGGTMIVDAATAVNKPDLTVGGLTIKDYKIVKAPILGRLLNALSPMGLIELLNDKGIRFLELESKWYYKNNILTFQTGRMAGSSLGLNYEGPINLKTGYMDIKGTIVPVDPVNRVVGTLPIIGQILGGKNGAGLFAATYEIKGLTKDPKVTVNPLAALAPGILRTIFFENGL